MSPLEIAVRAVCAHIAVPPDEWRAFREIAEVGIAAFVAALPTDLARAVEAYLAGLGPDAAP